MLKLIYHKNVNLTLKHIETILSNDKRIRLLTIRFKKIEKKNWNTISNYIAKNKTIETIEKKMIEFFLRFLYNNKIILDRKDYRSILIDIVLFLSLSHAVY